MNDFKWEILDYIHECIELPITNGFFFMRDVRKVFGISEDLSQSLILQYLMREGITTMDKDFFKLRFKPVEGHRHNYRISIDPANGSEFTAMAMGSVTDQEITYLEIV